MQRFSKQMQNNLDAPKRSVSWNRWRSRLFSSLFLFWLQKPGSPRMTPRDLRVLLRFRKPKVEKTKPNKEAEQQQQGQKKKKGFLPETKKRQKRQKPLLEPAGEQPTSAEEPGAEKGRAGTKKDKERKRKQAAGEASDAQPASAKKRKQPAQKSPAGNPVKKKKKPKQRKGNGAGE